jgi:DNA invertase Pin-like site-specific DNA recombinase
MFGVSITQEMGDDPMHVMMRQIMALFDEYQSKENAKHVLPALKENARQGFWNGSLPPIVGQVHRILTRPTYVGRHEFNKRAKNKMLKPTSEIVTVEVPPLIDQATFDAV